jgi:hypothetical protein
MGFYPHDDSSERIILCICKMHKIYLNENAEYGNWEIDETDCNVRIQDWVKLSSLP